MDPPAMDPPARDDEQPLAGGMDPAAGVVRIGDTVRRPAGRSAPAVRSLLLHLEDVGFDGAPRFLGTDEQGRDVLTFVEGDVPLPPCPAWSLTDSALADLGRLVRRFHQATASFDVASPADWPDQWADPLGGPVVCHNDLFPENVVFRHGRVVGLIDFAEAAPGRPFWDLAIAAQEWGPLHAPGARLNHPDDLDGIRRTALLADAYGVEPERAEELVDVVAEERAHQLRNVRAQAAAGAEPWATFWPESDGEGRAAADERWLRDQRAALIEAIRTG
jgi:Ser/Thr protein kinase RdoA (MazF antagonist)